MTAPLSTGRAAARAAPRPAAPPPAAAPPRPPLRVVEPTRLVARRRRRALVVVAVALLGASLVALVASHVVLTQGQFRLQQLRERAAAEQARYERLRLRVAQLESPARVVAAAQERLGMVPPPGVTYLSPSGPVSDPPERAVGEAATDDWARVKRQLASGP